MQRPKSARLGPIGEQPTVVTPPGTDAAASSPLTETGIEFSAGTIVNGRYEIVRLIGFGGMGAVYEANDKELERKVAIKVIRKELAQDPEILKRFKQELLLARQVSHRNVVRIYDLGEYEGTKYISMDYVHGRELGYLIAESGSVPPNRAATIALQICKGLEAAHNERVIHRDLKPQNIVVDGNDRVYIMDFGIARSMEQSGLTQTGAVVGTLEYMAPEQAKGETIDERGDLYAFGLIFYEMLTGQRAFKGETALGSLYRRTRERPLPPGQVNPSVPAPLSAIVNKCLEPDKAKRYQSAAEIVQDLDVWLGHYPRTDFRYSRVLIPPMTYGRRIAISAIVAVFVLALGGWYLLRERTVTTENHAPVSVLVADFANHTGDPIFDGTLEPMFNVALENANFVNAFNRGEAKKAARQLRPGSTKLDEEAARLVALNQSIGAVVTGSISRRGDGYKVAVEALDGANGNTIANSEITAQSKDEILLAIPKLAVPVRKALGDRTPESVQLAATAGGFSAASLEAVHQYGAAMEQQFSGDFEGALKSFSKAAELDPGFARAYSGMAASSRNLGRPEDAEKYFKSAMEHVDRMTERERLRTRGAYYVTIGNFPKCVEEYSALVSKYPSDNMGHNNLATCYSRLRNYPRAVEELKRAVQISPKGALQRANLSLNATYSSDFETGEREAREVQKLNPGYEQAYQTLADAQMGQGHVANAEETYRSLAKLSDAGASLAASGLADVAIYQGRFKDATQLLEKAAAVDLAKEGPEQAADKFTAVSYARLSSGDVNGARKAAMRALEISKTVKIRFLAAHVLARTGDLKTAGEVARTLAAESLQDSKVYAQLIDAEIALQSKDARKAIEIISQANKNLDTWIGRLNLARAYIEAGMFTEADSELDACIRRKGEAVELMDDGPTFGYFPEVYYLQGRVRQGLKSAGFAEPYRAYMDIRGTAGEDPLLNGIRHELSAAAQ
jgi:tetratricopeptide (TPR) repeat protein